MDTSGKQQCMCPELCLFASKLLLKLGSMNEKQVTKVEARLIHSRP